MRYNHLALLLAVEGASALSVGALGSRAYIAHAPAMQSRGALAACRLLDGGDGGSGGGVVSSGGSGDGDEEGDDDSSVPQLIKDSGLDTDAIPSDVLDALRAGRIGAAELTNWKAVLANPLTKLLASLSYIRNRLLADPRLPSVLGIELGVGFIAVMLAEKAARGEKFLAEIDFVIANQVRSTL